MLERDDVVRAIAQLGDGARSARGGALFVMGEAGLGKTAVLDHACKLASPYARVAVARGDPMETGVAFGLVSQVVEDLGGATLLGDDGVDRSPDEARSSRFHQALRSLRGATRTSPVLLAFDDVHWADPDSLALLSFLCRRITAMPVAVVATLRPWPPAAEQVGLALAEAGYASVERLRPLSAGAAGELLAAHLGRRPSPEALARACEAAAGNPLLLESAALALAEGGTPPEPAAPGGAGLHSLARAPLLRRFAELPEPAVAFARAASVLGRRFRPDAATVLARLDDAEADLALDALAGTGLVRHAGQGFAEFTYPLLQEALYDDLGSLVRDQLHGRAFRLLLDCGLEGEAGEHAVRGNLSGDPEAVAILTRAGRAALRAGAVGTAVHRLERAAALAGEHPGAAVLLLLGEALMAEGRADQAVGAYRRLLGQGDILPDDATEARRMLGRALFLTGEVAQGERRLEEAAALSGDDRPELAVRALLDLSRAAWLTAGPAGALPAAVRAREAARRADEGSRVQADAAWGFVAFVGGDAAGLEATSAAGRSAAADEGSVLRDLAWSWGTVRNAGRAAKYAERFDEAEAVFRAMFVHAERTRSPQAIASLAAHHADTLARAGRLDEALPLASRAVALAELAPMAAAFAHVVEALALLHAGRPEESAEACERAEQAARAHGQWLPLMRVWHVRALHHATDGRFDLACARYADLEAETARLGIAEPCLVPWARRGIAALVADGHDAAAERVRAWVQDAAGALPCRWPRIAAETGAAVLAEWRDDDEAAERHLRSALALHDEVDLRLERVETLLHWGAHLRRTGRVVDGREALREALLGAEQAGSRWLADQVQKELAVAGGRRRPRESPDSLTPQEQRVAELAGAGRSYRQIAGELSLSKRTVETHLRRIYAKLGIHSQRELMARARAAGAAPPGPDPQSGGGRFT